MPDKASKLFRDRLQREIDSGRADIVGLAKKLGVPRTTIDSWLEGTEPRIDGAERLARVGFGMSLGEFLGDFSPHSEETCVENAYRAAREGLKKSH